MYNNRADLHKQTTIKLWLKNVTITTQFSLIARKVPRLSLTFEEISVKHGMSEWVNRSSADRRRCRRRRESGWEWERVVAGQMTFDDGITQQWQQHRYQPQLTTHARFYTHTHAHTHARTHTHTHTRKYHPFPHKECWCMRAHLTYVRLEVEPVAK